MSASTRVLSASTQVTKQLSPWSICFLASALHFLILASLRMALFSSIFPTCQMRVSTFYQSYFPPTSFSFFSSQQQAFQWAPRELQISVTAGHQPRAPELSGHCRTPTHARENVGINATKNARKNVRTNAK